MIGRWTGAIGVFNPSKQMKMILTVVVPIIAFGVVLGANALKGTDISNLYIYIICVAVLIAGFFIGQDKPAKTLLTFSILAIIAMLIGLATTGMVSFCFFEWRIVLFYYVALHFFFGYCRSRKIHRTRFFIADNDDIWGGNYSAFAREISRYACHRDSCFVYCYCIVFCLFGFLCMESKRHFTSARHWFWEGCGRRTLRVSRRFSEIEPQINTDEKQFALICGLYLRKSARNCA